MVTIHISLMLDNDARITYLTMAGDDSVGPVRLKTTETTIVAWWFNVVHTVKRLPVNSLIYIDRESV